MFDSGHPQSILSASILSDGHAKWFLSSNRNLFDARKLWSFGIFRQQRREEKICNNSKINAGQKMWIEQFVKKKPKVRRNYRQK